MSPYRIQPEDGTSDAIAGQVFASYDEAYAVLERYHADLCCSDEREAYRIEEEHAAAWHRPGRVFASGMGEADGGCGCPEGADPHVPPL